MATGLRRNSWVNRLVALAMGLGLVFAFEGLLRLFGVAAPPSLVRKLVHLEGQTLYTINPDFPQRFFQGRAAGHSLAGVRMAPKPFVEPAGEDVFRVVFAGGSTVQGFPHPKRLAAASYLEAMLQDIWPERKVEVFNLGITAVSSFAVARCVEAAAVLEPDLLVVYTGHNEFYGVYGVAALRQGGSSIWLKEWHYRLMQLRLTRLLRSLLAASAVEEPPASLLRVMAAAGQVATEDPRRQRAAANLGANLSDIADFCRRRQIPLMLCTLVSNLRGFAPAPSEPALDSQQLQQWQDRVDKARELAATEAGAQQGLVLLDQAAQLWERSAELQFVRGGLLQKLGRDTEARAAYERALDWDRLPFRAPTVFNQVIRRVAANSGSLLADVEASFGRSSPGGSPGWALIDDHLHPSAAGQLLLARTIVAALAGPGSPRPIAAQALQRLRSEEGYRSMMGDLPLEQLAVSQAMVQLLSEKPLGHGHKGRVAQLAEEGQRLWQGLLPAERLAYERWQRRQKKELLVLNGADQLFAAGDLVAARRYYRSAQLEKPFTWKADLWATLRWARCAELLGNLQPADLEVVEAAEKRARFLARAPDANAAFFDFFSGYARHLAGDGDQALALLEKSAADEGVRRTFFFDLLWLLCEELASQGKFERAENYVRQIAAEVGQDHFGRQLLGWLAERRAEAGE